MTLSESICPLRPLLLEGSRGPLVGLYRPPAGHMAPLGDMLVVPAFAEEMNRCRSMVTLQALALAERGIGTLVLDPHGTGDSSGEFEEGDWATWRDDLRRGIAWLRTHGHGCRALLGVRLGALMAAELAADDAGIDRLLLWMPVLAGKAYWTQFLRIRIAAEMGTPDGVKSTDELRQRSIRGEAVEASGYPVGAALARQLDTLVMPDGDRLKGKAVAWFDVAANADATPSRASAKLADDWRAKGVQIGVAQVTGPLFWQVHERAVAPQLIDAATAAVLAWPVSAPAPQPSTSMAFPALNIAMAREYPLSFRCGDAELAGIVHRGAADAVLGVVIVVAGGPQYRVGAHRQFVSLGRLFASHGYPVMRFDLRGMGDSTGEHLGYHQSRADIRAAIDEFMRQVPGLRQVALFGECESASGILFYASQDPRVRQIALANTWVRTDEVQAEAILKHYYIDRLRSREFWRHVITGGFDVGASFRSLVGVVRGYWRGRKAKRQAIPDNGLADFDRLPLPAKTAEGLRRFRGPVLLLMSGRDLIAREFDEVTRTHDAWKGLLADPRVRRKDIADADHTFSKPEAKAEAQQTLVDWMAHAVADAAGQRR